MYFEIVYTVALSYRMLNTKDFAWDLNFITNSRAGASLFITDSR